MNAAPFEHKVIWTIYENYGCLLCGADIVEVVGVVVDSSGFWWPAKKERGRVFL